MTEKFRLGFRNLIVACCLGLALQPGSLLFAIQNEPSNPKEKQEDSVLWYGVIETPMAHLRTIVKRNPTGEKPTAWLISPDQSSKEFPIDSFDWDSETKSFECKQLRAKYSGSLTPSGVVAGKFSQAGGEFQLNLTQVKKYPPKEPRETWNGTLTAGPRKLQLQFRVFDSPDDREFIVFDSLNEGVKGLHATREINENQVQFSMPGLQAEFAAKLETDETKLAGIWKQGGAEFPFEMHLTGGDTNPSRPQTPQPPFDYEVRDVTFQGENHSTQLAGTLTIPKRRNDERLAAVVLVSGSGPQDRDETIFEHRPFAVIADYLTTHGIAVLRYDDRGVGKSKGDFSGATTQNFASDAWNAVKFLQTQPEIDATNIGIIGHSEGGLIAPIVAADHPQDVAFIVLLAGPGVVGSEIIKSQTQLMLAASGVDAEGLLQTKLISETLLESLATLPPNPTFEQLTASVADSLYQKLPEDQRDILFDKSKGELPVEQLTDSIKNGLRPAATPWYRYFVSYDPLPTLKRVNCPVLALNGEKDLQVDAKLNLPPIAKTLQHAKSKAISLPHLNHLFQTCETGAVDEYYAIEETIAPSVLKTMELWIKTLK